MTLPQAANLSCGYTFVIACYREGMEMQRRILLEQVGSISEPKFQSRLRKGSSVALCFQMNKMALILQQKNYEKGNYLKYLVFSAVSIQLREFL